MIFLNSYVSVYDWQRENYIRYDFVGRGGKAYMHHLCRSQAKHKPRHDHLTYTTVDQDSILY